ncbi:MAG: T9SS type A sorting domain-containing protein [Chitinophagaceae bacterium]
MKKLLPILSFILFTTLSPAAHAQGTRLPVSTEPVLRFFPNPATNYVTFEFQKSFEKGYTVQVFNFLGKKMFEGPLSNDRLTLNLSDFTRGVYIYQLKDKTGKLTESGKFQVSK